MTRRADGLSGLEGAGKFGKHGIVPDIQRGEFQPLGEHGRGDQVVTEADPGVRPAVFPHERRRPSGHLLADLEPLHAAEQAHDLAAFGRAHPPATSVRPTTLMASGPGDRTGHRADRHQPPRPGLPTLQQAALGGLPPG